MMDPERWQRIKQIFNAALDQEPERRAAFLDQACAGEADVRAEVLSLIAAHLKDGDFLDQPAAGMAAGVAELGGQASELEEGRRIGSYRIVGTLGAGGMGKVYLALDTRLGRKVALKLLPASFTMDQERVQRFEQEARAASALNHPNLLTIHEIGAEKNTHYIATEFVEGSTLREKLRAGRIKLHEVLEIAIQVGAALTARTPRASSIVTSSRRTSWFARTATSRFWTSASPNRTGRSSRRAEIQPTRIHMLARWSILNRAW